MTCCWCNGDHPDEDCWKTMTVERALRIYGPIRAARSKYPLRVKKDGRYSKGYENTPAYWLDGKRVRRCQLLTAAIRKVRDGEV